LPNLSFQNSEEAKSKVFGLLQKYAGITADEVSPVEILDSEAKKFLSASTFDFFQKINLRNIHDLEFQQSRSKVLSSFSKFTFDLKKEIKKLRIAQKEKEEKSSRNSLEQLMSQGTPLEKEIQIMKYQWEKLEELSIGHYADLEALITYKVKLMILLRWWSFHAEKGFENFTRMTTNNGAWPIKS
jgi:flagellar motor switch/type III secretory pathway protein FliN